MQLIGSDGEEVAELLNDELMDEMSQTGFREIWIADHAPEEAYGTVQLIGVKPSAGAASTSASTRGPCSLHLLLVVANHLLHHRIDLVLVRFD